MTPKQIAAARAKLGLTQEQMARMLGYAGEHRRMAAYKLETGARVLSDLQRRMIEAYLDGHRPKDWPVQKT